MARDLLISTYRIVGATCFVGVGNYSDFEEDFVSSIYRLCERIGSVVAAADGKNGRIGGSILVVFFCSVSLEKYLLGRRRQNRKRATPASDRVPTEFGPVFFKGRESS